MNKFLLFSVSATLLSSAALLQASPLFSVGDNVDVFFDGSADLDWSSNVFNDESGEVDDLVLTVSPGLEVDFGRGESNADLRLRANYDILRYEERSGLDTELAHVRVDGSYESGRWVADAAVSFDESQTPSVDAGTDGQLYESEVFGVNLGGEYQLSPKFSFGAGLDYRDMEYVSSNAAGSFADTETIVVPVNVFYELTPKVDLSFGYSRSESDVTAAPGNVNVAYEQLVDYYSVGARGDLLPKLSGAFDLGYTDNDYTGDGMLGANFNFSYAMSQKLTSSLSLSRGFGVGGAGDSTGNSSVKLGANYVIDQRYSVSADVGYDLREYVNGADQGREDDQYSAGLRLNYTLDQSWRLVAGYDYSENNSSKVASSYVAHSLSLSASFSY